MNDWPAQIEALRRDRRSGAAVLAGRGALALRRAAREAASAGPAARSLLLAAARCLAAARPSMAAVINTAAVFAAGLPPQDELLLRESRGSAAALAAYWRDAPQALARHHAGRFHGTAVLTHSLSSDVLRTLVVARPRRVVVAEARTGGEGRVTARRLAAAGIEVTLVPDAALGAGMHAADLALIGADSVLPDGGVINKAGSYLLALAALDQGKPVYALAESMKVTPESRPAIESAAPAELWRDPPERVELVNPLFEAVPGRLIAAILSEDGELDTATLANLVALFEDQRAALR